MDYKGVYSLARSIPKGRVSTYGEIALALGNAGLSRAVGNALNKNRSMEVPCHRVVRSDGFVGGFARGAGRKAEILTGEGIEVDKKSGRIKDFERVFFSLWRGSLKAEHRG